MGTINLKKSTVDIRNQERERERTEISMHIVTFCP